MIRAVKGMNDVRPQAADPFLDTAIWQHILDVGQTVLQSYGYRRTWLPVVEETALFARGIGEDTDIVSKEMYTFEDRGGRKLTLRPEGTAGAVRSYVEHHLGRDARVQRWWYAGPMFRAERPQKGRYRQFYQIGAELLGCAAPAADAELIGLLRRFCDTLGLQGTTARVNSLGDEASRQAYRKVLRAYLQQHQDALCDSCTGRLDTNPLRVLDCKRPSCQQVVTDAPDIYDVLTPEAKRHFEEVLALLDDNQIQVHRDRRLVRGLDYYTGTIFEFVTDALGAQDAILGGGRYDGLVKDLGGPDTPALGFAAGIERLALLVAKAQEDKVQGSAAASGTSGPALVIAPMPGPTATAATALRIANAVRALGPWTVDVDVSGAKLKAQMKRADRIGARAVLVLGEDEVVSGRATIKDLRQANQAVPVSLTGDSIAAQLKAMGISVGGWG